MSESDRPLLVTELVTDRPELTLDEVCRTSGVSREQIETYVAEGIVEPQGSERIHWRFSHVSLIAVRKAKRLERDLGLNAAGIAVALDLLKQIDSLKSRLALLEQKSDSRPFED